MKALFSEMIQGKAATEAEQAAIVKRLEGLTATCRVLEAEIEHARMSRPQLRSNLVPPFAEFASAGLRWKFSGQTSSPN